MTTSRATLSEWFDKGIKQGAAFMIVACDTFEYEDYPIYANSDNFETQYNRHNGVNMQQIMEVYDLSLDKEAQLAERRAFHYPEGFNPVA
jgi:hypothetical protein